MLRPANAEWLYRWLKDPKRYRPKTNMPNLRLTDQEARDIASYLMTLGRREVRAGLAAELGKGERVKAGEFRLMGFGHRVYKSYDPRASILKKACYDVVRRVGVSSNLLEIALKLEDLALKDDYFVSRKLYPNVDFYSGIIYKAMGIPTVAFTVMFALGRLPGWIAHSREYSKEPGNKINRPRQIYIGEPQSEYVSVDKRK